MGKKFKEFAREEIRDLRVYTPGKPIEEVKRELGLEEVYKLASNENAWGPSPKAIEAMKEALKDISRYPDSGAYELKKELAKFYGLDSNSFIFGNGSDQLVQLIAYAFFRRDDEILMGFPSFPRYDTVALMMGAVPVQIPLNNGYYPLEEILERISPKTRAIFICNPNNPSGTARNGEDIKKFVDSVPENILLVFDEAYWEFYEEGLSGLEFLEDRPVIVLRTFSKAYGLAGIRLGYAISHPEIIDALNRVREPFNVNAVAQAGALAALKDQNYLAEIVRKNKEGIRYLTENLQRLGVKVLPSQTNFVLGFFGRDARMLSDELLKRGLIVRPGAGFGEPDAIRITVGTKEENEKLIKVLEELFK